MSSENLFVFHLKYSFCRPLDSTAQGGHTTLPTLITPLFAINPKLCTFERLDVLTSQSYKFSLLGMFAQQLRRANISSVLRVRLSIHTANPDSCSSVFTNYLMRISTEICNTHRVVFTSIRVTDILHKYICKYLVITG